MPRKPNLHTESLSLRFQIHISYDHLSCLRTRCQSLRAEHIVADAVHDAVLYGPGQSLYRISAGRGCIRKSGDPSVSGEPA